MRQEAQSCISGAESDADLRIWVTPHRLRQDDHAPMQLGRALRGAVENVGHLGHPDVEPLYPCCQVDLSHEPTSRPASTRAWPRAWLTNVRLRSMAMKARSTSRSGTRWIRPRNLAMSFKSSLHSRTSGRSVPDTSSVATPSASAHSSKSPFRISAHIPASIGDSVLEMTGSRRNDPGGRGELDDEFLIGSVAE